MRHREEVQRCLETEAATDDVLWVQVCDLLTFKFVDSNWWIVVRICDYEYMKEQNIPADLWKGYSPTNRRFLNGYTYLYFDVNRVNLVLRNNRKEILEDTIFTREDCRLRDLFG